MPSDDAARALAAPAALSSTVCWPCNDYDDTDQLSSAPQASWPAASSHGLLNELNAVKSAALLAARDRQRLVRLWLQERLVSANVLAEDVLR